MRPPLFRVSNFKCRFYNKCLQFTTGRNLTFLHPYKNSTIWDDFKVPVIWGQKRDCKKITENLGIIVNPKCFFETENAYCTWFPRGVTTFMLRISKSPPYARRTQYSTSPASPPVRSCCTFSQIVTMDITRNNPIGVQLELLNMDPVPSIRYWMPIGCVRE